jgi:hypothetical protein
MTLRPAGDGDDCVTAATSERGLARLEGGARLLLSCIERPGIIAAVSQFLGGRGANILEADQHATEPDDGLFVMRIEFGWTPGTPTSGRSRRRSPPRSRSRSL